MVTALASGPPVVAALGGGTLHQQDNLAVLLLNLHKKGAVPIRDWGLFKNCTNRMGASLAFYLFSTLCRCDVKLSTRLAKR